MIILFNQAGLLLVIYPKEIIELVYLDVWKNVFLVSLFIILAVNYMIKGKRQLLYKL